MLPHIEVREQANQHLTELRPLDWEGERGVTLCGLRYEDLPNRVPVYDHRDGFSDKAGMACGPCADAADRIQNGGR